MKQAVQITVLGHPYTVRTDVSPAEVRKVAEFVNDQVEGIMAAGRSADTLNTAVLALLNMGGAYLHLQEVQQEKEKASARLSQLLRRLEEALPEPSGKMDGAS